MAQSRAKRARKLKKRKAGANREHPRCGLCGSTENLTKTECCNQWVCDDEDEYVLFSYERNSCYRNHRKYTLCGHHYMEDHEGDWKTCPECRADYEHDLEMYVFYGTNEFNFEKLPDPPKFEPTHCTKCGAVIVKSNGGYSESSDGVFCHECTAKEFGNIC